MAEAMAFATGFSLNATFHTIKNAPEAKLATKIKLITGFIQALKMLALRLLIIRSVYCLEFTSKHVLHSLHNILHAQLVFDNQLSSFSRLAKTVIHANKFNGYR